MAPARSATKAGARRRAPAVLGWLLTLFVGTAIVIAGFALGLVLGVASEEPLLLAGHLGGRTTEVPWRDGATEAPASELPAVAARPPEAPPVRSAERGHPDAAAHTGRSVPAASRGGLAVQVGAFSRSEAAEALVAELRGKGYPAYLATSAGARDGRWRVRVGPYALREEAEREAARLKQGEALPTWILDEAE